MAGATLSLDDLIALNEEIAALARVSAPLEPGLLAFARETRGGLRDVAGEISQRLSRGESLLEAVGKGEADVPPLYAAMVDAGVRTGRLPAAMEGLAELARRLTQLRRVAALALAYPLTVLILTYFLLLFFMTKIAPRLVEGLENVPISVTPFFAALSRIGERLVEWWWAPPVALVAMVVLWWHQAGRALLLHPQISLRWLGWVPWFGKVLRYSQLAAFADTLALLVEHRQPLPEAIVLAAQATGSKPLCRAAAAAREALEQGTSPAAALRDCRLPPLVCWLLGGSHPQAELADTLRMAAEDYHARATYQAEKTRAFLPLLLTVGVAGTAVAVYALILFIPWTTALRELSE